MNETENKNKIPTISEALLYMMFKYPLIVDYSKLNPLWLDWAYERKMYDDLTTLKLESVEPDLYVFIHKHQYFLKIWTDCELLDNVLHWKWEGYCDLLKDSFYEGSVSEFMDRCKTLDPKEAVKEMCDFVDKIKNIDAPQIKVYSSDTYALDYQEELEALRTKKDAELKTGFPLLDEYLWGLHRGELVVFGARPAIGKSTFMLNVTANLLRGGSKVMFFSTEMSAHEQWSRLLPILTEIEASKFRRANFEDHEWGLIVDKLGWLKDNGKFIVCDSSSPTVEQVISLVRRYKPDVVILDYLQRFTMPDDDRMDLAIGNFLKQIKTLSRTENVSILIPSQLNRQVENRNVKIPTLSDLRESGNIEQEADVVILLGIDDQGTADLKLVDSKILNVWIAKNRHGKVGNLRVQFNQKILKMLQSDYEPPSL